LNFLHSPIKKHSPPQRWRQANQTKSTVKTSAHKKARPDFSGAGCEVQGKLEVLEKLTVVGSFAV
jgi:hypothetical protein